MSFEGYYQRLCKVGHYNEVDVYNTPISGTWNNNDKEKCYICDESIVWEHLVDQTNGDEDAHVIKLAKLTPEGLCTCECGNQHTVDHAIYFIPKKDTCNWHWSDDDENDIYGGEESCNNPIEMRSCDWGYVCKKHRCRCNHEY